MATLMDHGTRVQFPAPPLTATCELSASGFFIWHYVQFAGASRFGHRHKWPIRWPIRAEEWPIRWHGNRDGGTQAVLSDVAYRHNAVMGQVTAIRPLCLACLVVLAFAFLQPEIYAGEWLLQDDAEPNIALHCIAVIVLSPAPRLRPDPGRPSHHILSRLWESMAEIARKARMPLRPVPSASSCLDRHDAEGVLNGDGGLDAIKDADKQARQIGVEGVPLFIIDGVITLSGAQRPDAFLDAFGRAN
jgi:DSBA-like thioredoxin domain